MQHLPLADPGLPDLRSASRFLLRVARLQRWTVLGGMALGVLGTGSRALDEGRFTELDSRGEPLALGGSSAALRRSWQSA